MAYEAEKEVKVDHVQLADLLKQELAAMRKRLDELSSGQAELIQAVGQIRKGVGDLLGNEGSLSESGAAAFEAGAADAPENAHDSGCDPMLTSRKTAVDLERQEEHDEVHRLIEINNRVMMTRELDIAKFHHATWWQRLSRSSIKAKEMVLDAVVSFLIFSNTIFIGISTDNWSGDTIDIYCYIDLAFSVFFLAEMAAAVWVHGFCEFYFGQHRISNLFDATLVFLDTTQLVLVFVNNGSDTGLPLPWVSLFRFVRLLRITRILRLLRHDCFVDLVAMLEGLVNGTSTLLPTLGLFFTVLFVTSLICRDMLGNQPEHKEVYMYFNSVPRSMYTVFRCSFGDCSTLHGTPIPEFINQSYGALYGFFYSLFIFFVTIGFFNVISALYTNATLEHCAETNLRKSQEDFADEEFGATRLCAVLKRCLVRAGYESEATSSAAMISTSLLKVEIDRSVFDRTISEDKVVIQALNDLRIDRHDHGNLADILDPNHSGTLSLFEIVNGLHRLRGQPRRSDIVAVDLMLREAQLKINDIYTAVMTNQMHLANNQPPKVLKTASGTNDLPIPPYRYLEKL